MSFRDKVCVLASILLGAFINQVACGVLGADWGRVGVASKPGNHYERNSQIATNHILSRGMVNPVDPQRTNPIKSLVQPWTLKRNETDAERMERIHRAFEKMLTLVNIASQVDDYVSSKVKTVVKKVSGLVDSIEQVGSKQNHCNH